MTNLEIWKNDRIAQVLICAQEQINQIKKRAHVNVSFFCETERSCRKCPLNKMQANSCESAFREWASMLNPSDRSLAARRDAAAALLTCVKELDK